jgi:hypothetical protein
MASLRPIFGQSSGVAASPAETGFSSMYDAIRPTSWLDRAPRRRSPLRLVGRLAYRSAMMSQRLCERSICRDECVTGSRVYDVWPGNRQRSMQAPRNKQILTLRMKVWQRSSILSHMGANRYGKMVAEVSRISHSFAALGPAKSCPTKGQASTSKQHAPKRTKNCQ